MKIVITNAYTWLNKGDAGILIGTIDLLRDIYGDDLKVNILSFSPDLDAEHYRKLDCVEGVYENVISPYKKNPLHIPVQYLNWIRSKKQLYTLKFNPEKLMKQDNFRVLKEADYVIACGGGYLGGNGIAGNYLHLYLIAISLRLGKHVIMLGNSVEPGSNKKVISMLHNVLGRLDKVFAREKVTYDFLEKTVKLNNLASIPDMAFMLKPRESKLIIRDKYLIEPSKLVIGITVRKSSDDMNLVNNYIDVIADTITYFVKNYNAVFVFIPQVRFKGDDDLIIANQIREKLDNLIAEDFILMDEDYSPGELKTITSQCDLFFGTRMHSNIFATSMGVPTVAIAYQNKTNGIMHMLNMDRYVINIDSITLEETIEKIEDCIENLYPIKDELLFRTEEIQKEIYGTLSRYITSTNFSKGNIKN